MHDDRTETRDLILEQLLAIQADLDLRTEDLREIKRLLGSLEEQFDRLLREPERMDRGV